MTRSAKWGVRERLEHLTGTGRASVACGSCPTKPSRSPTQPRTSAVTADSLITLTYGWSNADGPQDGLLLIGNGAAAQPAPPGPDWGWRMYIGGHELTITMLNIPEGEAAYEVVRAAYTRA